MAPELIGGGAPTYSTDQYAAGILLYEMLSGQTPFVGSGSTMDVLSRHLHEAPVPPARLVRSAAAAAIAAGLEATVLRALAKTAPERFASLAAFREALTESLSQRFTAVEVEVLCVGCGVTAPAAFKFCPECGQPRGQATQRPTRELPAAAIATRVAEGVAALAVAENVDVIEALGAIDLDSAATITLLRGDREAPKQAPVVAFPLPLVGRARERNSLLSFARGDGPGTMLLLVGEPGSGRSRLIREVCEAAGADGTIVYLAGADPSGMASPFYPVRAIASAVLALPTVCGYEGLIQAVDHLGLSRRDLPGIAELFGYETGLWQLEPPVRGRELLAATIRALRAASERGPTVLVFEDIDRYDAPSRDLLRRLAHVHDAKLRVIVTASPELATGWPAAVQRVELAPLTEAEVSAIIDHLRRAQTRTALAAGELVRLTGGSPALIQQVLRYTIERGAAPASASTLANLVVERLALLPQRARVVLQAAVAVGCESSRDLLRQILDGRVDATGIDNALSLLDARDLLVLDSEVVWFHHALIRDVAYESTPVKVRRELHDAIARCLETRIGEPAVLGHHHERAGNARVAAELLSRAGDVAAHQLDDHGACALYQRSLGAARRRLLADDEPDMRSLFVEVAVKLADALRATGRTQLAHGVVEEARGHCCETPALEAQLERARAQLLYSTGDEAGGITAVQHAIALALGSGQTELLTKLYLDLSSMHLRSGDAAQALAEIEEGVDLVTLGEGPNASTGPHDLWRLLLRLAQLVGAAGRGEAALALGEAALAHAARVGSGLGAARVQALLADLHDAGGRAERAAACREYAVTEMRRLGDRRGTAELLLASATPTANLIRVEPASLREARALALEIGWQEGVRRAEAPSSP
jgi:serine/threonine-protein kinase